MEIYVVQSGDTVYQIARRFAVPMDELIYVNQLENPAVLSVGQALIIPGEGLTHTVRSGETLYSIAQSYSISLQSLIAANPQIQNPDRIDVGQKINIPRSSREIIVNGYVTNITDRVLSATLPYLTFLSPFSYQADGLGALTPTFDVNIGLSANYRVANLMTLTNFDSESGFSGEIAHALFTDQTAQQNLFNNILTVLRAGNYYGLNLDFEYVLQTDQQNYNNFLRRLTDLLHENGYIIVTALAPKLSDSQEGLLYSAHDYAFHGKTVDYVVLMTYEWGYTYGPPMAVAPLNQVRRVLDYAVTVIPPEKILMGMPNYGYDWTVPFVQGTAARPLTNVGAVTLAGQMKVAIQYDNEAQSPFFRYTSGGKNHEVWFEDARSLRAKMRLVEQYALAGVSFWNLNSLFRTNFLVIESMYGIKKVL